MSIEAMKQALEALEEINQLSIGENAICLPAEIDTAMDALRQAIAEAEKQEPVVYELSPTDIYDFAGWLTTRKGLMQVGGAYEAGPMADAVGEYLKTYPERFTAKPKREWVGLTMEDKKEFLDQDFGGNRLDAMDWADKRLKEKNT